MLRLGGAVELALVGCHGTVFSLLSVYQFDRGYDAGYWDNHHRMGVELSIAETVAARGGMSVRCGALETHTVGGALYSTV
jgi:hypothetical protein